MMIAKNVVANFGVRLGLSVGVCLHVVSATAQSKCDYHQQLQQLEKLTHETVLQQSDKVAKSSNPMENFIGFSDYVPQEVVEKQAQKKMMSAGLKFQSTMEMVKLIDESTLLESLVLTQIEQNIQNGKGVSNSVAVPASVLNGETFVEHAPQLFSFVSEINEVRSEAQLPPATLMAVAQKIIEGNQKGTFCPFQGEQGEQSDDDHQIQVYLSPLEVKKLVIEQLLAEENLPTASCQPKKIVPAPAPKKLSKDLKPVVGTVVKTKNFLDTLKVKLRSKKEKNRINRRKVVEAFYDQFNDQD